MDITKRYSVPAFIKNLPNYIEHLITMQCKNEGKGNNVINSTSAD